MEDEDFKMLSNGLCKCIYEPRGDNGLEGYQLENVYKFEEMFGGKQNRKYFRVYPEKHFDYYETCGKKLFKKYFNVITRATF